MVKSVLKPNPGNGLCFTIKTRKNARLKTSIQEAHRYDHVSSFESGDDDSGHNEEGNDVTIDKVDNAATDTDNYLTHGCINDAKSYLFTRFGFYDTHHYWQRSGLNCQ